MYRLALRATPRISQSAALRCAAPRRFASTAPANKHRTWKSSVARWGLAVGAIYYYNTSTAFAEEPIPSTVSAPAHFSDDDMPTVDAIVAQKRKEAEVRRLKAASDATAKSASPATNPPKTQSDSASAGGSSPSEDGGEQAAQPPGSPEALEAEAGQQGAFNPETGEINWDCPCLGGMADGPCGENFKAAFSCFVYSTEEPKGMDCIDKFQAMQDCFRLHPEIYGEELADDEESAGAGGDVAPPSDEGQTEAVPAAASGAAKTEAADAAAQAAPSETTQFEKSDKASEKPATKQAQSSAASDETKAPRKKAARKNEPKADPIRDATQAN